MKKGLFFKMALTLILALLMAVQVSAAGYNSYTYNTEGEAVASPDAYRVKSVLNGIESGAGGYASPSDICSDDNGLIYIADSGKNRIVCLDESGKLFKVFSEFTLNGEITRLLNPQGIYVRDNTLYISDTDNSRILVSDMSGNVKQVLSKPSQSLYPQNMAFTPQRLAVDTKGNVYALCRGVYYGAVTYNIQGEFVGFFGCNTIEVTMSLVADYAWRKMLNYEQRSQLDRYLPVSYSSIDVDNEDFMYVCTAGGEKGGTIRKLNHKGTGVINDADFREKGLINKNSYYDTVCDGHGFIIGIDKANNRILEYDSEGNLLFAFGLSGGSKGTFTEPVAITVVGDSIYVLDKTKASVTQFVPTEFGAAVREATELYNNGRFELAIEPWERVLQISSGYQNAYMGIGKSLYFSGDYEQAAKYFKIADSKEWNSKAFKEIRAVWLHDNFVYFLTALCILAVVLVVLNIKRFPLYEPWHKFTGSLIYSGEPSQRIRFALHTVRHPLDGFTELHEKRRSSVAIASVIVALTALGMMIKVQYSGFRFNSFNSRSGNIVSVGIITALIILLFVVANWALCVLFDSEAFIKDIFCCTAYSLVPFTVSLYISTALSYVLCTDEAMIMTVINGICLFWTVLLIFFSFKEIHQYTVTKTVLSLLCTLVALVLVAFLVFMMFSLFQQMLSFVKLVISELSFRLS